MRRTVLLATIPLSLAVATGCNEHPLKETEYQHETGIDSFGGTEGEASSDDGATEGADGDDGWSESGDAGTSGDVPDCGGDHIEITKSVPTVVLVLDKSGSMTSNTWDHDGTPATAPITRWKSLHGIVSDLLTDAGSTIAFGAALFPAADAGNGSAASACRMADGVEVPVALDNAAAILAAIPGAGAKTAGGTPARQGVLNALDHLVDTTTDGPKAIVLVTDGAANCVPGKDAYWRHYDDELELVVASANEDNDIPTYVVGIDIVDGIDPDTGRNVYEELQSVALAGGVARTGEQKFYNALDHATLQGALQDIAARVECTISLDRPAAHPDFATLEIAGEAFAQLESCEDGDGWRWTDASAPWNTIELCNAACDRFREVGELDIDYTCPPEG